MKWGRRLGWSLIVLILLIGPPSCETAKADSSEALSITRIMLSGHELDRTGFARRNAVWGQGGDLHLCQRA